MSLQASSETKTSEVRHEVYEAVQDWRARQRSSDSAKTAQEDARKLESVLQPIERRRRFISARTQSVLPNLEAMAGSVSMATTLRRLVAWMQFILGYSLGNALDWLLRRDSPERRAVRLRRGLERAGGTFVKLGQQAALRIDLLPWAYCVELSKMLDQMVPFDVEDALQAIERSTGRPWQETFAVFDPDPIGSASIACVYQAVLKDGRKVAVKVRRPGITETFLADFQILDWLSELSEALTIFRPGFTKNLRLQLRETLTEELDFRREARFQDTFRRNARRSERDFFTAPRVLFELSSQEVLVQEFVSGVWLYEVIAAIERKDQQALQMLEQMGIDPKVVARRIMWATFWSMDEHVFFHADPHPANILIREDNQLTFIDFGSCGSLNNHQQMGLEQMAQRWERQDAEGMALAALSLLEPLPPVDVPALMKKIQDGFTRFLRTFQTPAEHTEYWERTSARQWVILVQVARQFNLPLNLNMLRMIRATLLYDSIVIRLDPELNRQHEYKDFMKDRARFIRKRWRRRLREETGDRMVLRLDELSGSINDLLLRAQSTLGRPVLKLSATIDKWIFAVDVLTRMAARIVIVGALAAAALSGLAALNGGSLPLTQASVTVARSEIFLGFVGVAVLLNVRHIMFRFRDKDTDQQTS